MVEKYALLNAPFAILILPSYVMP